MSDQSDSEDKNKRQEAVDPELGDWSPDYFPVSAKPIFRRSLMLLCGVAILCLSVAYCSEHEVQNTQTEPEALKSWSPQNAEDTDKIPENPTNQDEIPDNDAEVF